MIRFLFAVLLPLAIATGADAQPEGGALDLGTDRFRAGSELRFDESGAGDVFFAGGEIGLAAPIAGSAHLAGRRIAVTATVPGALYAAGSDIEISADVGSATLAGYALRIEAPVAGSVRAFGSRILLGSTVGGTALLAGQEVEITGSIAGDVALYAETLRFGPDARIDGRLVLYGDDDAELTVPDSVAPPERVERRSIRDDRWQGPDFPPMTLAERLAAFGGGVLLLTALGTLAASVAPQAFDRLRTIVADAPWRTLGFGFLALSLLTGATILLVATILGIVLAPFALIAAVLLAVAGYVVAVYLLGVWIVTRGNMLEPDTFPEFALTALAGALAAGLLGLVPFLGWIVPPLLTLTGAGAIALALFGRRLGI
jgi:hypothetical protein